MKLHVGDRLPGSGPPGQPGGYVVTGVLRETPWTNLYSAKKILYNFDFASDRCRESDPAEWLDVLLRTCSDVDSDIPEKAAAKRAIARAEVRTVLANRASNLWPEPVDLLAIGDLDGEIANAAESDDIEAEPVIVLERPHGESLADWLASQPLLADRLGLVAELFTFVQTAHAEGLVLNGLGPDAFVVDGQGRIGYLASDCVVEEARHWRLPWLFPPERYPLSFSAPECFDPEATPDTRSDWFAWAAIAFFALTGEDPQALAQRNGELSLQLDADAAQRLEAALRVLSNEPVRQWVVSLGLDVEQAISLWPFNLVRVVERCLAGDLQWRPKNAADMRHWFTQLPKPPSAPKPSENRAVRLHAQPVKPVPADDLIAICEICGQGVARSDLETHLRRIHRIFSFHGQTRPLSDTFAVLLDALFSKRPDGATWKLLQTIAHEEYPAEAEGHLATWLAQKLLRVAPQARRRVAGAVAEAVAEGQSGPRMAVVLSGLTDSTWQKCGFHLALEIACRLAIPLDPAVMAAVQPRLNDNDIPADVRLRAAAQSLRSVGPESPEARDVAQSLVAGSGKVRAIKRLDRLEELAGKSPAIDDLRAELQDQLRMSCPRCAIELKRVDMVRHLWDAHGLVLDGQRVREPWRAIEDWLEDYRVDGDPDVLQRCWSLARRIDAKQGPARIQRLMLQHGIEDGKAREDLLAEAKDLKASLCPHCFAHVPVPLEPAKLQLEIEPDSIEGAGYRVEIADGGIVPRLEIETPTGLVFDGAEPGRRLTKGGAILIFAGPLLVVSALLLFLPLELPVPGGLLAVLTGGLMLVVFGMIMLAGDAAQGPLDRVLGHAWNRLVPHLLKESWTVSDRAFVAALATASVGQGDPASREKTIEDTQKAMEEAVAGGRTPVNYLGAIRRLAIEDIDPAIQDPTALLAAQTARCLDASLPLGFATALLASVPEEPWNGTALLRLRVLLADRAFDAGLELQDLRELASANRALGNVLEPAKLDYLAHLKLMHLLKATKPWSDLGRAKSIFDISQDSTKAARLLKNLPDVMLAVDLDPPLYLGVRGAVFLDTWFYEPPRPIEVIARTFFPEGGFHLILGKRTFWFGFDPIDLCGKLEKWFDFYFKEFCPQLGAVYRGRGSQTMRKIVVRNGLRCPECRRRMLPVTGAVGIAEDTPLREEMPMVLPIGGEAQWC
jgi:hypothetical protein